MKPIIKVENISKRYRLGTSDSNLRSLRDALTGLVRSPLNRLRAQPQQRRNGREPFVWALKDVSFEVEPGEVVGIIGKNGAGKSTLLKILSRITEPTGGQIDIYGRIGSLLEVGTGFHGELTGRENLFLNGAILGMKRAEIERKFDEIVAFSEIEKFIDTPVKWYSSGMYLRLAFSVAAHLEPEILILDEVLAVGDAAFQIKCMNKIDEIRKDGRTILFVSHNMQAVTRLCRRAVYLSEGVVVADGPTHEVARTYLSARLETSGERVWGDPREAPGNDIARLRAVRVSTDAHSKADIIDIRRPINVEVEYEVLKPGLQLVPNIQLYNEEGTCIFLAHDLDPLWYRKPREAGLYLSTAHIPGNFLAEGTIQVGVALGTYNPLMVHFYEPEAVTFQVVDTYEGDSARGDAQGQMMGVVRPILDWDTKFNAIGEQA